MSFNENATLDTSQVESGGSGGFGGGGRGGFPGGIQVGGGIGGLIMLILMLIFGGGLTGGGNTTAPQDSTTTQGGQFDTSQVGAAGSASGDFANCKTGADANRNDECLIIATVNSVQAYWGQLLPQYGKQYPKAKTVIYSGQTQSGCGTASNQVGPFYCPCLLYTSDAADERSSVDLGGRRIINKKTTKKKNKIQWHENLTDSTRV